MSALGELDQLHSPNVSLVSKMAKFLFVTSTDSSGSICWRLNLKQNTTNKDEGQ